MNIDLKTPEEIVQMRAGGKIAARILKALAQEAVPGKKTLELDRLAQDMIQKAGAKASFKGFHGFPAATCISINDEVVHGIPSERTLKEGDIVGIDLGIFFKGFHTDTALTVGVGQISPEAQKLINVTRQSLDLAIKTIKPGIHLGDAQALIQQAAEAAGFNVIRDLVGHGVGRNLQELPNIPNYGQKGKGLVLKEGMTLAIEPMIAAGHWHVQIKNDGWTVVTVDKNLVAHFEHTIAVTEAGAEILTQ